MVGLVRIRLIKSIYTKHTKLQTPKFQKHTKFTKVRKYGLWHLYKISHKYILGILDFGLIHSIVHSFIIEDSGFRVGGAARTSVRVVAAQHSIVARRQRLLRNRKTVAGTEDCCGGEDCCGNTTS